MTTRDELSTDGDPGSPGTCLRILFRRGRSVRTRLARLVCGGTLLACFARAVPAVAQIGLSPPGGERGNLSRFVATGTTPMDIRARAIRDRGLVSAILRGSRTRRIRVLVDDASPELGALAGRRDVRVRLSAGGRRGRFGKDRLSFSFVLEIGGGYYEEWGGPLIWTPSAFAPVIQFIAGSGQGPGETWPMMSRTFDRDFSVALPVGQRR